MSHSHINVDNPNEELPKNLHFKKLIVCILIGTLFWFMPAPEGVSSEAWHLLAIFIATILGLVIKPMPMGALALVSLTISIATKTLTTTQALENFSSQIVWLVLIAFFIAKAFVVTGLGNRIAYIFTGLFGKKSLGLAYSVALTNVIIGPAIPSAMARAAGIVYPIVQSISRSFESFPHNKTSKKIGEFLTLVAFQATPITSAMFLTAMAANPMLTELSTTKGINIDWWTWAKAAFVPSMISLIIMPLIIYFLYPPEIKETPNAQKLAKEHLKQMGRMTKNEWILAFTLILLLILWSMGSFLGVSTVEAALIGISILLVTGALNWKVLAKENDAWETFVWFCVLITMAKHLNTLGLIDWFSNFTQNYFDGVNWKFAFPIISLIYFYSHYLFASLTAHVSSMYLPFLIISISVGTPPALAALILIFFSNLFGCITHYSTSPAPLLYGAGYVDIKTWWKLGFIMSLAHILVWSTIGVAWWKFIGLW